MNADVKRRMIAAPTPARVADVQTSSVFAPTEGVTDDVTEDLTADGIGELSDEPIADAFDDNEHLSEKTVRRQSCAECMPSIVCIRRQLNR